MSRTVVCGAVASYCRLVAFVDPLLTLSRFFLPRARSLPCCFCPLCLSHCRPHTHTLIISHSRTLSLSHSRILSLCLVLPTQSGSLALLSSSHSHWFPLSLFFWSTLTLLFSSRSFIILPLMSTHLTTCPVAEHVRQIRLSSRHVQHTVVWQSVRCVCVDAAQARTGDPQSTISSSSLSIVKPNIFSYLPLSFFVAFFYSQTRYVR